MELNVFTMFVMATGLIQSIIVLSMVIFKSKFTLDKQRKIIISILLADTLLLLYLTIKQSFMFTQRFQVIIIMSYIQLEAVPLAGSISFEKQMVEATKFTQSIPYLDYFIDFSGSCLHIEKLWRTRCMQYILQLSCNNKFHGRARKFDCDSMDPNSDL